METSSTKKLQVQQRRHACAKIHGGARHVHANLKYHLTFVAMNCKRNGMNTKQPTSLFCWAMKFIYQGCVKVIGHLAKCLTRIPYKTHRPSLSVPDNIPHIFCVFVPMYFLYFISSCTTYLPLQSVVFLVLAYMT